MSVTIPKQMQALVYRGRNDLRLEQVPVPKIRSDEVLVKMSVCGVCPTDIKKIQYATVEPPRIFGHESSGTIVQIGARVRGFRIGDRVGLHHHVPCMNCHACRHRAFAQCPQYKKTGVTAGFEPAGGGFAEYVRVMPFCLPGLVKIPRHASDESGAMLEPVNTVLKAVMKLELLRGDIVMVVGQGPIGLLFTKILSLRGHRVIATDLLPNRLRLARQWGASHIFHGDDKSLSEKIAKITQKRGLDASVIAVPADAAVDASLEWVRGGGKILLFAHTKSPAEVGVDMSRICVQEKDLVGSYSSDFTLQKLVASLVFSGKLPVERLITHRFGLENAIAAIEMAAKPGPEGLKVVVQMK